MNDYDMFKNYRLDQYLIDPVIITELTSQIGYMNDIARNNVDRAVDEDKIELSYYWNGFADILESMSDILEPHDPDYKCPSFRRKRMCGMIDACRTIIRMIEDEEFNQHEE